MTQPGRAVGGLWRRGASERRGPCRDGRCRRASRRRRAAARCGGARSHLAAGAADTVCAGRAAAARQNRIELASAGSSWAVTTDHLVPGRKRRKCYEPEAHSTLHGVVFAILYLGLGLQPFPSGQARWSSWALRGTLPERLAASSRRPAPADILR